MSAERTAQESGSQAPALVVKGVFPFVSHPARVGIFARLFHVSPFQNKPPGPASYGTTCGSPDPVANIPTGTKHYAHHEICHFAEIVTF